MRPRLRSTTAARRPSGNRLIDALPRGERMRMLGAAKLVPLEPGDVLHAPGESTRYVWFPLDGFVSLSLPSGTAMQMQLDLVGSEGMLGAAMVLGVPESSQRAQVLDAGAALRISNSVLKRELRRSPALRRLLNRYVHVLMMQLVQNVICVASHKIAPRLARLLLMSQDRASSKTLNVTQAILAAMLGVRRVGVTEAAGTLQRRGLIRYSRGRLAVIDRPGLERASCDCYRADRTSRQRWLG